MRHLLLSSRMLYTPTVLARIAGLASTTGFAGPTPPALACRHRHPWPMHSKLLIDQIVRQTTVLIARLSTTAGIRAPLAHIADQVFLELAQEIERQGVARKVVADMFGVALRTYQRRVQRISECASDQGTTLWEAVLNHIATGDQTTRQQIFLRFRHDGEENVGAVLRDLVSTGVVYKTGRGKTSVYGVTPEADYRQMVEADTRDSLSAMIWVVVYRTPGISRQELCDLLGAEPSAVDDALSQLVEDGRIATNAEGLHATDCVVPLGSGVGWEAAVFDHFQAMAKAIAMKLENPQSGTDDSVGGMTYSFDVWPGHPMETEVLGLLARTRASAHELWDRLVAMDEDLEAPEESVRRVTFYAGQGVEAR